MITLTPAYGRDYKSKAAVEADIKAGKDFILNEYGSTWDGKPVNLEQLRGCLKVNVRFGNLRKVAVVTV